MNKEFSPCPVCKKDHWGYVIPNEDNLKCHSCGSLVNKEYISNRKRSHLSKEAMELGKIILEINIKQQFD